MSNISTKPGALQTGCELFAALMKADSTHRQLVMVSGVHPNSVNRWLKEMRASGIVYRRAGPKPEGRGRRPVLHCLNAKPFEHGDEVSGPAA